MKFEFLSDFWKNVFVQIRISFKIDNFLIVIKKSFPLASILGDFYQKFWVFDIARTEQNIQTYSWRWN